MHPLVGHISGWGLIVVNAFISKYGFFCWQTQDTKQTNFRLGLGQWTVDEQRELTQIFGDELCKWRVTSQQVVSLHYTDGFPRDWGMALFLWNVVERYRQQILKKLWSLLTDQWKLLSMYHWTCPEDLSDAGIWRICLNLRSIMNWRIRVL